MKKLLPIIISLVYCTMLSGHNSDVLEEKQFIVLYTLGEIWDLEKGPANQKYFTEHSNYLQGLRKEGRIVIGARYSDTGMLVIKATDETVANELIHEDVAVEQKLLAVQIFPFSSFYKGCVE